MPHQSIIKQIGEEAEASRPIQQQRLKFHASPIKDTCSSNPSSTPSKCRGPNEEASHRHVPQARTLCWLASSSRASFKTSRVTFGEFWIPFWSLFLYILCIDF